ERVDAGNLYVNRGITGAIVQRQPFGGWKRSSVGATAKAGGPNHLHGLVDWAPAAATGGADPVEPRALALLEAAIADLPSDDAAGLRRAAASDEAAWRDEFGLVRDAQGLAAERNALRYLPVRAPLQLRVAQGGAKRDAVRLALAGLRAGAPFVVSTAAPLPAGIDAALRAAGVPRVVETDAGFRARLAGARGGAPIAGRLRLVASDAEVARVQAAIGARIDLAVWSQPVVESGRVELLPFLLEQAVSMTAHRFGTPTRLVDGLL
ncbi:MAG: aldehyde dehydrogenase family protein, partial [Microbacteriaceae bacterium]|nr:aldehyde dehydrogenase family protein [Microbacteriaceae bacterium]